MQVDRPSEKNMDDETFKKHIDQFAYSINQGRVGLVNIESDTQSTPLACYENVKNKVIRSGGMPVYGWTFLSKRSDKGGYLIAQHHAIWGSPERVPLDITPYLDGHVPLTVNDSVLFLIDLESKPVVINGSFFPTPSKFYPLKKSPELELYLSELESKEISECSEIYRKAESA